MTKLFYIRACAKKVKQKRSKSKARSSFVIFCLYCSNHFHTHTHIHQKKTRKRCKRLTKSNSCTDAPCMKYMRENKIHEARFRVCLIQWTLRLILWWERKCDLMTYCVTDKHNQSPHKNNYLEPKRGQSQV